MTDINIGLQGSLTILILCLIAVLSLSYYYYKRTIPNVSKTKKTILRILRLLSLFLLILILFEPVIYTTSNEIINPHPVVFIDNSASVNIGNDTPDKINNLISNLDLEDEDYYYFDSKAYPKSDKDADYEGQYTDISSVFEKVKDIEVTENISSVIVVTDGAFNKGINPEYAIENMNLPVVAIGVGEEKSYSDIIAKSMLYNDISYINNDIPILAKLQFSNIQIDSIDVNLLIDNKLQQTQRISISKNIEDNYVEFTYSDSIPGKKKITIKVDTLSIESNKQNNNISNYINILDNKKRVSIFASAPSPDVSFINQFLSTSKQYIVSNYIKKNSKEWYTIPTQSMITTTDIFVLIDFPANNIEDNIIQGIAEQLANNKSVLYLAGKHVTKSKIKDIEKYLPFTMVSDSRNEFLASINFNDNAKANSIFAINRLPDDNYLEDLPPLYKTEAFYKAKPDANIYADFKVNNVKIEEPTIVSKANNLSRSWAFLAYGLYRWEMIDAGFNNGSKYSSDFKYYNALMDNVFKWLSISDKKDRFIAKTDKNIYQSNETIEVNAQIYDDKYEPLDDMLIKATLKAKEFEKEIILKNINNGRYVTNVEGLPEGDYSLLVTAFTENNDSYLQTATSFSIETFQVENRHYGLKKSLLERISVATGGVYMHIDNIASLQEILSKDFKGADKQISLTNETNVWNSSFILVLVIILLSAEWFLRKRFGML